MERTATIHSDDITKRILVIHSGGLDSTCLLYKAISLVGKSNVATVSFTYGQKHPIELDMARWHAEHLGIKHYELNLTDVFRYDTKSTLLFGNKEIEEGTYDEIAQRHGDGTVDTYVPYRNGTMLSIATSLALSLDYNTVAYGAHLGDASHNAYPDTTASFITAQSKAILEGSGGKVRLWAPFGDIEKRDVVKEGIDYCMTQEEFQHTHSCYNGVKGGCGKCGTCHERRDALDAWPETRGIGESGQVRNIVAES